MLNKREKRRRANYKEVFSSEIGKEILEDLLRSNYFFTSTHGSDPYETAYNEGRRSVVCAILNYVTLDIDKIQARMRNSYERGSDSDSDNF
jgi:formyltetrahydrofolate hydrolase